MIMRIAIGNDHAATALKFEIMEYVKELGHEVVNFGTDTNDSCNYPEIGARVGHAVVEEGFSYNAGKIRQVPVRIGGSSYIPPIPFEAQVKEEIDNILFSTLEELDKAIEEHGSKMKGFENLISIKGIGPKGAAILLSTIGHVEDFRTSKQLAAYIGIVPRVSNSNDTVCHGRITKQGSKIARTTLVQCALIAKRYSPYLNAFHEKIKSRRGGAKANIALARKFLDIIFRTLKYNWVFEDFTQFKLKEN